MTDTTDQQAVTVAPIDAALDLIDELYRKYGTELDSADTAIAQAARNYRLASVSSASAEGFVPVPREPSEDMLVAARDWSDRKYGKPIGNDAAQGCWSAMIAAASKPVPADMKVWLGGDAAPIPEPVPAANQAGEVEAALKAIVSREQGEDYAVDDHPAMEAANAVYQLGLSAAVKAKCSSALVLADRLRAYRPSDEWGDRVHHAICTEAADMLAALATQPATSQEGEGFSHEWCLNMAALEGNAEIGAGSPDHPLRCPPATNQAGEVEPEAVVRVAKALCSLTGSESCSLSWGDWVSDAKYVLAALAQVKAS